MEFQPAPPREVRKRNPRPSKYDDLLAELKAHPGEWAKIGTEPIRFGANGSAPRFPTKIATRLRSLRTYRQLPLAVTERRTKDDMIDVWACWQGDE
jgi:hypothetical protein